jgi:dTDP-4-dehydrorhamnose reductase
LSRSTILVLGASGQVGGAALQTLETLGVVVAPTRQQVDLTDPESIRSVMREIRPLWVINAAAHTAVDKAEIEPELAYTINAEAPRILGEEARKIGAVAVHFSTDYVFDGSNASAYLEAHPTGPLNVYGKSKLAGEQALAATGAAHLILRTSWVYGATGKNFLLSILRMARDRDQLRIVTDQHGAPTWSFDLARLTAHLVKYVNRLACETGCDAPEAATPLSGIYHASGAGQTTWFGFAEAAAEALRKYEPTRRLATVSPILTAEYPTPARRPANSLLECSKLERNFGWRMMHWQESLEQVMRELFAGGKSTNG